MVEGMESIVVTVSGYHGTERTMVIKLVSLAGANYVGKMSRSITHLVCWKFKGEKYELAKKFGTLVVNHQWLDDCIKEGKRIPEYHYTLQSGQEIGFNIQSLPAHTRTSDILCENDLLLNKPNMHDCFDDVVDLVSDEIENDYCDDDLLLDENIFPVLGSRKSARQKRKLVKRTSKEDRRAKADMIAAVHELWRPAVVGFQIRSDEDRSIGPDFAESSHRSRRLVKKNSKRHITEIDTIDQSEHKGTIDNAEHQDRTHTDVSEHNVTSSLANDSFVLIESSNSRRLDTPPGHGQSKDEVNHLNNVKPFLNPILHGDDTMNAKGGNIEKTSLDFQSSPIDQSKLETALSCVICWTEFSPVRGVLPCGHRFCFSCIQNWADRMATNRKESTCPLCKASFASITRVDAEASFDQKIYSQTIPCPSSSEHIFIVPEGRAFHSGIQDTFLPVCCQCQNRDPADLLIPCHVCENSCIHHYCLDPPITPWICNYCRDHRFLFRR